MIRIHLTSADLAHLRIATSPAPLQELNAALMMLVSARQSPLLFGRWRARVARALPATALLLRDIVPGPYAPAFLDSTEPSLAESLEVMRAADPQWVAAELKLAYAAADKTPAPWISDLHRGGRGAWQPVTHAERAVFNALLAPVWPLVQDLHRSEFARHAATAAQRGVGRALTDAVPGSRLSGETWELPTAGTVTTREVHSAGRGILLLPTFHWVGPPLISDLPGRPVTVTFPAGSGLPLSPTGAGAPEDALADVLGAAHDPGRGGEDSSVRR